MTEPVPEGRGAGELARALEPALHDACGGRLGSIGWFRADWQRGGAATGYSSWDFGGGEKRDVVVKLPVGPRELRVTTALAQTDAPSPRVVGAGSELGGYDLAWLVMERLPGDPHSTRLHKDGFVAIVDAAARVCGAMDANVERPAPRPEIDWAAQLDKARHTAKESQIPQAGRWNELIHETQKKLPLMLRAWSGRSREMWKHGDLHPGNAMDRPEGSPWGPAGCVLIDFAEAQAGSWIEDAVYLEHLHWAIPDQMKGIKPVSMLARARRSHGLECGEDYADQAQIKRALLAATVPANLSLGGTARQLDAALGVLERTLPLIGK